MKISSWYKFFRSYGCGPVTSAYRSFSVSRCHTKTLVYPSKPIHFI